MTHKAAIKKLNNAFFYLRPRFTGDTIKGIAPNADALAGKIIAEAMVQVVTEMECDRLLNVKHIGINEAHNA